MKTCIRLALACMVVLAFLASPLLGSSSASTIANSTNSTGVFAVHPTFTTADLKIDAMDNYEWNNAKIVTTTTENPLHTPLITKFQNNLNSLFIWITYSNIVLPNQNTITLTLTFHDGDGGFVITYQMTPSGISTFKTTNGDYSSKNIIAHITSNTVYINDNSYIYYEIGIPFTDFINGKYKIKDKYYNFKYEIESFLPIPNTADFPVKDDSTYGSTVDLYITFPDPTFKLLQAGNWVDGDSGVITATANRTITIKVQVVDIISATYVKVCVISGSGGLLYVMYLIQGDSKNGIWQGEIPPKNINFDFRIEEWNVIRQTDSQQYTMHISSITTPDYSGLIVGGIIIGALIVIGIALRPVEWKPVRPKPPRKKKYL